MDQQISSSVSSQTVSTALQAASDYGKSAGKGVFAKLLAIIEGKADADGGAGSEKSLKDSSKTILASSATSIVEKAKVNLLAVEQSAVQKSKPEQVESSDSLLADTDIEIQKISHLESRLSTTNNQVELQTHVVTDTEDVATRVKADMDQSAKTGARAEVTPVVVNHDVDMKEAVVTVKAETKQSAKTGARAEVTPAVVNHDVDMKEAVVTVKAETKQSAKIGARGEVTPAVVNHDVDMKEAVVTVKAETKQSAKTEARVETTPVAGMKDVTVIVGKVANPDSTVRNEHLTNTNEQRIAGIKVVMQQVVSSTMQPEKTTFVQAETSIISGLPEQYQLSTNSFVKSRKVNLDHSSKTKTQPIQLSANKKSEVFTGHHRQQSIQSSESFTNSMRDVIAQTESFSRSGHHSFDSTNVQIFQASGSDAASTLMRSVYQPHQSMLNSSGPWPVAAAMQQIGHAAGQGKFQLELTLTPEHLGKIQVFLDSDINKQIHVHFIVEQSASRQSIEQHLPALRQALADQGLNMDSFSMESSEQGKENHQNPQNRHSLSIIATTDISSSSENRAGTVENSRLSIRI